MKPTPLFRFCKTIAIAVLFCLLVPVKGFSLEITNMYFTNNPGAFTVQCGDSITITAIISFKVEPGDLIPTNKRIYLYDATGDRYGQFYNSEEPIALANMYIDTAQAQ